MSEQAPPTEENGNAATLWKAFAAACGAQQPAIAEGDAMQLDALLAEKGRLLLLLGRRDAVADVAANPALLEVIRTAQEHDQAAGEALGAAHATLARELALMQAQRLARNAFNGRRSDTPELPDPRFLDRRS